MARKSSSCPEPGQYPPAGFRARQLTHGVRAALLGLAVAASLPMMQAQAAPVASGQDARRYDIPAGRLSDNLALFAATAGVRLSFDPRPLTRLSSAGLKGDYTVSGGFVQLLAGSGYELISIGDGSYSLRPVERGSDGTQVLEQVVVTDRADREDGFTNSASSGHISRADMDRFPPATAGDIFRDMAGVTVANNRNGAGLDVNIRGMQGFGRVKVLVDGTESSSSSYKGYGGESSRAYVDPELLGSVTVEKGPNAGPYGAGVVGGIVHMSTLSASDLITDADRSHGLRVRVSTANNQPGESRHDTVIGPPASGSADINDAVVRGLSLPSRDWTGSIAGAWRPAETLELVAGFSRRRHGNYLAGSRGQVKTRFAPLYQPGGEVYNTSEDTESTLLKAKLKLPASQSLELGYSRMDSEFGEARSAAYGPPTTTPGSDFLGYITQLNLSRSEKQLFTARYAWSPADNPWADLRVNVWAANADEYQAGDIRGIAMISGIHRAQDVETRGRGGELWNTSVLALRGMALSLKYGGTWLTEKVDVAPLDGGIYMEPNGERELRSAFLQAELKPFDALTLDAGVRRERYEVRGYGEVPSGVPGQILPLHIRHGESRTNPSAGLTWQATPAWQFFGRYSEGWRPASAKETVNGLVAASNIGRALLKPEFTRGLEVGTRLSLRDALRPGDRFNAELAWFDNKTEDYVFGFSGEFRNADSADIRGLELTLDYDAGPVFGRYAFTRYTDIRFCGVTLAFDTAPPCFGPDITTGWDVSMSGLYIPPQAQHSLTLGTRLLDRRLTLGTRLTAARDHAQAGESSAGWSDYQVWDLFGSYRVNRHLNASLNIDNLRDRFHTDMGTSAMIAIPAPGRTARFSLTYAY